MVNRSWVRVQLKKKKIQFFGFLNPVHCAAAKADLPHNRRGKAEVRISSADAAPKIRSEQPQREFAGIVV